MFGTKDTTYYCGVGYANCQYNYFGVCKYRKRQREGNNDARSECRWPERSACTDINKAILAHAHNAAMDALYARRKNAELLRNQRLIMEHFKIKGE